MPKSPDEIRAAATRNRLKINGQVQRLQPARVSATKAATAFNERQDGVVAVREKIETMSRLKHIPGFFPTPKTLAAKLAKLVYIRESTACLEPSAGKGDLAQLMQDAGGTVDVCEINHGLREMLRGKFNLVGDDFLLLPAEQRYSAILLNPPFEDGQDRDHLRHAANFLAPGGKLAGIVSAGMMHRTRPADVRFRKWLFESHDAIGAFDAEYWENDPNAFDTAESERRTGVRTFTITVQRSK